VVLVRRLAGDGRLELRRGGLARAIGIDLLPDAESVVHAVVGHGGRSDGRRGRRRRRRRRSKNDAMERPSKRILSSDAAAGRTLRLREGRKSHSSESFAMSLERRKV
jgi:hypothetical protein